MKPPTIFMSKAAFLFCALLLLTQEGNHSFSETVDGDESEGGKGEFFFWKGFGLRFITAAEGEETRDIKGKEGIDDGREDRNGDLLFEISGWLRREKGWGEEKSEKETREARNEGGGTLGNDSHYKTTKIFSDYQNLFQALDKLLRGRNQINNERDLGKRGTRKETGNPPNEKGRRNSEKNISVPPQAISIYTNDESIPTLNGWPKIVPYMMSKVKSSSPEPSTLRTTTSTKSKDSFRTSTLLPSQVPNIKPLPGIQLSIPPNYYSFLPPNQCVPQKPVLLPLPSQTPPHYEQRNSAFGLCGKEVLIPLNPSQVVCSQGLSGAVLPLSVSFNGYPLMGSNGVLRGPQTLQMNNNYGYFQSPGRLLYMGYPSFPLKDNRGERLASPSTTVDPVDYTEYLEADFSFKNISASTSLSPSKNVKSNNVLHPPQTYGIPIPANIKYPMGPYMLIPYAPALHPMESQNVPFYTSDIVGTIFF